MIFLHSNLSVSIVRSFLERKCGLFQQAYQCPHRLFFFFMTMLKAMYSIQEEKTLIRTFSCEPRDHVTALQYPFRKKNDDMSQ